MPFFATFVIAVVAQFGPQRLVNLVVFRISAAISLGATTRAGRTGRLYRREPVFQIGVVPILACRAGASHFGPFVPTTATTAATTTAATFFALFGRFACRSATRTIEIVVFVRFGSGRSELVIDEFVPREFEIGLASFLVTRFMPRFSTTGFGLDFVTAATTTATTAAATLFATLPFVTGTIETQAFFTGRFVHFAGRHEIVEVRRFAHRFGMRFWRPIFNQTVAKATAGSG
jgi:hypothetical protein